MRKNFRRHNYLIFLGIVLLLMSGIKINGSSVAKYTVPIVAVIIIIAVFNGIKWIFPAIYLAYRIWRKTRVLSWGALKQYLNTDKSVNEIELEFLATHKRDNIL